MTEEEMIVEIEWKSVRDNPPDRKGLYAVAYGDGSEWRLAEYRDGDWFDDCPDPAGFGRYRIGIPQMWCTIRTPKQYLAHRKQERKANEAWKAAQK